MKPVIISSHGKVILSGEHSVVYSQPAILASIGLGITVRIEEGVLTQAQRQDPYLQRLLEIFADFSALPVAQLQFGLTVQADLPQKSGLGSSAAFAAALLQAVAAFYQVEMSQEQLYQLVVTAENFVHGRSSGADPAIVVHGGALTFTQGKVEGLAAATLREETFFLIDSGAASESTGEMVARVAAAKQPALIARMGKLTRQFAAELRNNFFQPHWLSDNQLLLEELGVVGASAQAMIDQLRAWGADCKITGAGGVATGSGYILAHHPNSMTLHTQLQNSGWRFVATHLGV